MSAQTVPGSVVRLGLRSARLPLSTLERLIGRSGIDISTLPPIAALDAFEAQIKKMVGNLLADEGLYEEGERQEEALHRRAVARRMSTEADRVGAAAEARFEETVDRAETARDRARREAEERRAEIERQEEAARREAEEKARRREEATRKAARTRQKAVEAKERQAELERIKAQSEALDREAEAVDAERAVTAIDDALDAKRTARRTGGSSGSNSRRS